MGILKYLKYIVLFLLGSGLGIGFLLWHPFSKSYYCSCVITYDKYDHPLATVDLQGHKCELEVRIGSRFPLFLNKEILDGIEKQSQGTTQWHDIHGQQHEAPVYLISKMKVGDLTLKNVLVNQTLDKKCGTLGKFLGGEFNLLIDFPHSRIIACDTFSRLKAKGLTSNHWACVPFEWNHGGIVLQVNTDLGTRKLALNTTSTTTLIRSSLTSAGGSFDSSTFSVGGQEFGNITFFPVDLPEGLDEIDGFIGMDFLKKHAIYLDCSNKFVYIESPQIYFERFPITFGSRGVPSTDVFIEGTTYPIKIDFGNSLPFSLNQEILQNIHKTSYGTVDWSDFKGNKYQSPAYMIPEIKIGNLSFINVIAHQDREDFHDNVSLNCLPSQRMGAIGLPLLKKYNLFLDFPHSAIYASNNHFHLQQAGLLSKNLLTIPFILHPDGILLSVETDVGVFRLILDTAATHTAIRTPCSTFTSRFRLMGHDFGARSIIPIDLNSCFDYDGYLGIDFLCEYAFFIDYPNRLIFLDLQKEDK